METRKFQVKDFAVLLNDITIKTGNVETLYAAKDSIVQVMAYDPSKDVPYSVRADQSGYRNVPVPEDQLSPCVASKVMK